MGFYWSRNRSFHQTSSLVFNSLFQVEILGHWYQDLVLTKWQLMKSFQKGNKKVGGKEPLKKRWDVLKIDKPIFPSILGGFISIYLLEWPHYMILWKASLKALTNHEIDWNILLIKSLKDISFDRHYSGLKWWTLLSSFLEAHLLYL